MLVLMYLNAYHVHYNQRRQYKDKGAPFDDSKRRGSQVLDCGTFVEQPLAVPHVGDDENVQNTLETHSKREENMASVKSTGDGDVVGFSSILTCCGGGGGDCGGGGCCCEYV